MKYKVEIELDFDRRPSKKDLNAILKYDPLDLLN